MGLTWTVKLNDIKVIFAISSPLSSGFEVITVRSWSVLDATKPMFRAPPVNVFLPSKEIVDVSVGIADGENVVASFERMKR